MRPPDGRRLYTAQVEFRRNHHRNDASQFKMIFVKNIFENLTKKIKEAKETRQPDGPIELTCTKMFPKRLIKVF